MGLVLSVILIEGCLCGWTSEINPMEARWYIVEIMLVVEDVLEEEDVMAT